MQIDSYPFANLEELAAAVRAATADAKHHKAPSYTVYTNGRLVLVKEFLTDGSKVLNVNIVID